MRRKPEHYMFLAKPPYPSLLFLLLYVSRAPGTSSQWPKAHDNSHLSSHLSSLLCFSLLHLQPFDTLFISLNHLFVYLYPDPEWKALKWVEEFLCMATVSSSEKTASHLIYVQSIFCREKVNHLLISRKQPVIPVYHGFVELRKRCEWIKDTQTIDIVCEFRWHACSGNILFIHVFRRNETQKQLQWAALSCRLRKNVEKCFLFGSLVFW